MRRWHWLAVGLVLVLGWQVPIVAQGPQGHPLPQLSVRHRAGQTFVTWSEVGGPQVTYNLYRAPTPITAKDLDQAELVATGIPQGTAHDFLADQVAKFWKKPTPPPANFTVVPKDGPLPAGTGLFVYTPGRNCTSFYALTTVWPGSGEERSIRVGVNSQLQDVAEGVRTSAAILIGQEREGDNVRLEYLHWATPEQASVDGHPYRFRLVSRADERQAPDRALVVRLHPYTGNYSQARWTEPGVLTLGLDDFTPAIPEEYHHTFWYGNSENLGRCYLTGEYAERAGGAARPAEQRSDPGAVRDYTRRRMLWTIEGVIEHFKVDKNRVYLTGGSMGGTGTVAFGLRHPEVFAALDASVPLINPPRSKAWAFRLLGKIWQAEDWPSLPDGLGQTLAERLDDTAYVLSSPHDLPLVKFVNGRQDGAIGWTQIPEFIQAMQEARQPFLCAWHNGKHRGASKEEHPAFTSFDVYRLRRDQCVPALANASTADDPGTGDPADGDLVGAINDDFRWEVEKDTADELVLRLWRVPKRGRFAEVKEATVDVTPRRRQAFRPGPGSQVTFKDLSAEDGSVIQETALTVEASGLLTARQVRVSLEPGSRLVFSAEHEGN